MKNELHTQMNEMDQIYLHSHLVFNTSALGERRKGGQLLKLLTTDITKNTNH